MKHANHFVAAGLAALACSAITFTALAAQPPLPDLRLWLTADTGVTTNSDGTVMAWADQATGLKHDGTAQGAGIPVLMSNSTFPSGPHPTISFDGTAALVLSNRDSLQIPALSVYVVASVDSSVSSGVFLADMRDPFGFALGINDTTPGQVRWYTGVPNDEMSPAAGALTSGTPYLIAGVFADGNKKLFINGTNVANATGKSLNFATWSALAVGAQGVYPNIGDDETGDPAVLSKFLVGEIAEILAYSSVSDAQRLAVEAFVYQKYFTKPAGAVAIAKQPISQQINELGSVTFSVNADGAPPLTYQWFKDGQSLASSDAPFFTIPSTSRTNAGSYTVKVSNAAGSATSNDGVLTVVPDTSLPKLLAADRDFLDASQVTLVFSKPVSSASATATANYAIDNGIAISKATMGATPNLVVLTTSAMTFGPAYTLTVNAVQDLVGNTIAANTQRRVTVPDPNAPVPTADLKLWLRADVDVKVNTDGVVTDWNDRQVGNPAKNGTKVGSPMLTQATYFANGSHPVVTFDGASGFNLANVADLRPTNMTFYIVGSVAALNKARIFMGNYRDVAGWCVGISDSIDGRVKWFTAPPNSLEPEGGQLTENTAVLLTATYTTVSGIKRLYVNGVLAGSATNVNLSYANDTQLTVGYLQGNRQYLMGDIAEILAYSSVSDSQRSLVEAYLTRKYFSTGSGPAKVVLQPASQTVNELASVTFEVGFEGTPPVSVQWYRNNTAITDATNAVYTIASATRADDQAQFNAHISNAAGSAVSSNAVLTVIRDNVIPVLVGAKRVYLDNTRLLVSFSKALGSASATNKSNYSLGGGVTVSQVTQGSDPDTVVLTTSPIAAGANVVLTVNGVQDLVGNPVAVDSHVTVVVPGAEVRPPTANLLCWLAADFGVTTDENQTITGWNDLATNDSPHNFMAVLGTPKLAVADFFPSGPTPVIHFDGNSGIQLSSSDTLGVPDISVYAVASTEVINASRVFIFDYRDVVGWGLGISDGIAGRVKWFTAPPDSMEPDTANLSVNVPVMVTGTFDASGNKKLYLGTNQVGSASQVAGIEYGDSMELTVGYLQGNRQFLVGTVAEVLVYSAVSDDQRAKVQDYLIQKYFKTIPGASAKVNIDRGANGIGISWTGLGVLESAAQITGPWSDAGSTSPVTVTPTETMRFYRLKQ